MNRRICRRLQEQTCLSKWTDVSFTLGLRLLPREGLVEPWVSLNKWFWDFTKGVTARAGLGGLQGGTEFRRYKTNKCRVVLKNVEDPWFRIFWLVSVENYDRDLTDLFHAGHILYTRGLQRFSGQGPLNWWSDGAGTPLLYIVHKIVFYIKLGLVPCINSKQ